MDKLVSMQQVHGANVQVVTSKEVGTTIPNCDGIVTNDPEVSLSVRVADCLPITIKDEYKKVVALVHAGWRGLESGIIENALKLIQSEFSSDLKNIEVCIGPHICGRHYEVKNDVASKFKDYSEAITEKEGKIYLDLAMICKLKLTKMGVSQNNITIEPDCTYEDRSLPSFRRDATKDRLIIRASLRGKVCQISKN